MPNGPHTKKRGHPGVYGVRCASPAVWMGRSADRYVCIKRGGIHITRATSSMLNPARAQDKIPPSFPGEIQLRIAIVRVVQPRGVFVKAQ